MQKSIFLTGNKMKKPILLTVVIAAICLLASCNGAEEQSYTPARVIDMEHHMFNAELIDYLRTRTDFPYCEDAAGIWYHDGSLLPIAVNVQTTYKVSEASTGKPMISLLLDMDDIRLVDMETAGVTTAVVSSGEGPEFLPKDEAVKYARMANDAMAEAMKKHPGTFVGSITLPTPYVEESLEELERAAKELGLKYWHTHSNYGHTYLYEKKYEPILAKCAELGIPFYIHPSYPTTDYLTNYGTMLSTAGFGFGVDVMKTAICVILNGTFDRYPDLKMILGHTGEFLPFCLDRMDDRFAIAERNGNPDPYVNNKRTFTDLVKDGNILVTTSGIFDPLVMEFIIKKVGIDKIMLGTDYPYEDFKAAVDFIKNLPISNEDKDKILYKNAEKYILK